MNKYLVIINKYSHRTGEALGKTVCFVEAYDVDEAENKAWTQHGSDSSSIHSSFLITDDNNSFTVYN